MIKKSYEPVGELAEMMKQLIVSEKNYYESYKK